MIEDRLAVDLLLPHIVSPSAQAVARLGARYHAEGLVEDVAAFEPHYLKAFCP